MDASTATYSGMCCHFQNGAIEPGPATLQPHSSHTYMLTPTMEKPPAQQPTPFSPPLAMQQSVWDSTGNGNFINAKVFAFSRISLRSWRVDTPKALFVNAHVLAAAYSYFQTMFSSSDGVETPMNGGLPPGVEPFSDPDDWDPSDFDDPVQEDPEEPQPPASPDAPERPQKLIKTYVVKGTAYKVLRAIVWYIYSGEITFSDGSRGAPNATARSIYTFADEHGMGDLKALASGAIVSSIDQLSPSELVEEACSFFVTQHPDLRRAFVERLPPALSRDSAAKLAFQKKISSYFRGNLPHCKDIVTSTLLCLLDKSTIHTIRDKPTDGGNTILRVSSPWPGRTKEALRVSLDNGIFDDFKIGPVRGHPQTIYFSSVVLDSGIVSSLNSRARSQPAFNFFVLWPILETDILPLSWQALAYYTYTGCITFARFGSKTIEPPTGLSPSDAQFRGYPCLGEVLVIANELGCTEIVDLLTEISPGVKALRDSFAGSPPIPEMIEEGVKAICGPGIRNSSHIQSQLREILEEAASGSRLNDLVAFSACFSKLLSAD